VRQAEAVEKENRLKKKRKKERKKEKKRKRPLS